MPDEGQISISGEIVSQNLSKRAQDWWPAHWLELGSDGFGNYYVGDLSHQAMEAEYEILFIDHEAIGREGAATSFASSYFQFLSRAIDEMMATYDPYGRIRKPRDLDY